MYAIEIANVPHVISIVQLNTGKLPAKAAWKKCESLEKVLTEKKIKAIVIPGQDQHTHTVEANTNGKAMLLLSVKHTKSPTLNSEIESHVERRMADFSFANYLFTWGHAG